VAQAEVEITQEAERSSLTVPHEAVGVRLEYRRFNGFHRWMHFLTMTSFTVLVFTGMPLKYKELGWAQTTMNLIGGVESAAILHRLAALVTIFAFVCEAVYIAIYIVLRRGPLWGSGTIMWCRKDLDDIYAMFRWFFNRGPYPRFDRFTYWEKFDFWSLAGGTVIIGATGLMMWYPVLTAKLLPGIFLNIALVIHSNEALLAVGVIFIFVHLFSAHLKPGSFPLDKVIFDGSLPFREYAHERPVEYERRVSEGTLQQVLVEKETKTLGARLAMVLWYVITAIALACAVAFGVFLAWATLTWIGLL
jgi:cytochrome b subunit of formate dehydrogenase